MPPKEGNASPVHSPEVYTRASASLEGEGLTPEAIAAFGGELDPSDSEVLTGLDRGDDIEAAAPPAAKADENKEPEGDATPAADGEAAAAEVEAEGEAESEEAEAPVEGKSKEKEGKQDSKEPFIPKRRFDEVNERRKAAEARLAEIEREQAAAKEATQAEFDFDAKEQAAAEALLDGKLDEYRALRKEIRAAERAQWQQEMIPAAVESVEVSNEQRAVSEMTRQAEIDYAVFDETSEEYSQELTERTVAYYQANMRLGKSRPEAMRQAIADVVTLAGIKSRTAPAATPEPEPTPKVADLEQKRRQTAAKLEKAKQAPPALSDAGEGSGATGAEVPDVNRMTDEEIAALPAATLKRLRGDYL